MCFSLALYILVIAILLPTLCLLSVFYTAALYLQVYRWLKGPPPEAEPGTREFLEFWDPAKKHIATAWGWGAWLWHGHEVVGLDKIPSKDDPSTALLVYYHAAFPIDFFHFFFASILAGKRTISLIVDKWVMRMPVFGQMVKVFESSPGSVQSCVETLRQGKNLAIAPGGVYEGFFSDTSYPILWRKRLGFAKVALEAQVPIIPIFTRNCQEVFRTPAYKKWGVTKALYELTRFPLLMPIYGGFPVKLVTFVGDPIPYDPTLSPEELGEKVKASMRELIKRHQPLPGSIQRALEERWKGVSLKKED